jgi:hypothetical protein
LPLPTPDHSLAAIAHRVRVVVERTPGRTLDELAETLLLEPIAFRRLVEDEENPLDATFVLDTVASLVYCQGLDPQWLLTGQYDAAMHRRALSLGEERGAHALRKVRQFVQEQFERQRRNTPPFLSFPPFNSE